MIANLQVKGVEVTARYSTDFLEEYDRPCDHCGESNDCPETLESIEEITCDSVTIKDQRIISETKHRLGELYREALCTHCLHKKAASMGICLSES